LRCRHEPASKHLLDQQETAPSEEKQESAL